MSPFDGYRILGMVYSDIFEEAFLMFYPTFEQVEEYAREGYNLIPVTLSVFADMDTPISAFRKLETDKYCFLLESVEGNELTNRYSFIGRNPFLIFKSRGDIAEITDFNGVTERREGNPIDILNEYADKFRSPIIDGLPSFSGGAVGCFAYDLVRLTERLPEPPEDDLDQPDMHFMFTDEIVAFDNKAKKIVIMVNIHPGENLRFRYDRAVERLIEIKNELSAPLILPSKPGSGFRGSAKAKSNISKERFCENVEKAKEYIKNGDIFQVVLSQRFEIENYSDPLGAYRAIRVINPSPYMYFLKFDDYQIAGASPELLVRVEDGIVYNSPIAGSRPRGKTPEEDKQNEIDLLADPKENAEHIMLVDLGRNDVGKVCEFGTVEVTRLKYIQRFSHIMHMTSDIRGKLRKDKTPFDALRAVLPAGTLSGAPKIRAMEIIDELETRKRGFYGGAIGYIGFGGSLDSCITIRTALFKDNKAYVQAGAGIVYDSVPETEYSETVNKAMAMIQAIERAGDL